jgi:hypothetical protein
VHTRNAKVRPASALPSTSFVCAFVASGAHAVDTAMIAKTNPLFI